MLTKRAAIIALFSGVLAKMAHADDPNWKPTPYTGIVGLSDWNKPTTWFINLDQVKQIDVRFGDKVATITAAEIFEALSPTASAESQSAKQAP